MKSAREKMVNLYLGKYDQFDQNASKNVSKLAKQKVIYLIEHFFSRFSQKVHATIFTISCCHLKSKERKQKEKRQKRHKEEK